MNASVSHTFQIFSPCQHNKVILKSSESYDTVFVGKVSAPNLTV